MRREIEATYGEVPEEVALLSNFTETGSFLIILTSSARPIAQWVCLEYQLIEPIEEIPRGRRWILQIGDEKRIDVLRTRQSDRYTSFVAPFSAP